MNHNLVQKVKMATRSAVVAVVMAVEVVVVMAAAEVVAVAAAEIVAAFKAKRIDQHVVVTGRGAPKELIELADLVTEMKAIKHPFDVGVQAQAGIEF